MFRRPTALLGGAVLTCGLVVVGGAPSQALEDSWAAWGSISGSSNDFTTTMSQQSPGFPAAAVRTDSRASIALPSGQSTFLGASTPPGATYGSSVGNPYLNLRPRADTPTAPSRTTYTFDGTTPDTGWAFVLGDIDADRVQVTATDAAGEQVTAATIATWFQGTFNYAGAAQEVPRWDPTTATLTGREGFADTSGASGWFEPTTGLSSLTFTFTREAGFPVYQTWFVSRARPVSGTLTLQPVPDAEPCEVAGKTVRLSIEDGREVATATTGPDGTFSFGDVATRDDYVVRLETGEDCRTDDAEIAVDNEGDDGSPASRADFSVAGLVPEPISGRVTDTDDRPIPGVTLTLARPGGGTATATTDGAGRYVFDGNPAGSDYRVTVTPPAGCTAPTTTVSGIEVAVGRPSTGNDFELVATDEAPPSAPPTTPAPTSPPTAAPTAPPSTPPSTPPSAEGSGDGSVGGSDGAGTGDAGTGGGGPPLPDTGGPSPALAALGGTLLGGGLIVLGGSAVARRRP